MVWAYRSIVFLSAFILFQIELITTQRLLPHFGGSFQVWSTSLVCYNLLLLIGYAAVDYFGDRLSKKFYPKLHAVLLLLSSVFFFCDFISAAEGHGVWSILYVLLIQIGLPFLLLSMTLPLIQLWSGKVSLDRAYNLYFYSGLGSVLGLVSYPFLGIVIRLSQHWQSLSGLYLLLGVLFFSANANESKSEPIVHTSSPYQGKWFFGSFVTCFLMLTATNMVSQFIGSIPVVWIIPLVIYLLSFMLVFRPWYSERVIKALLVVWCLALAGMFAAESANFRMTQILLMLFCLYSQLFLVCTVVNHKVYLLRPQSKNSHLNLYLNLGGFCASVFVSFAIPLLGRVLKVNFLEAGVAFVLFISFMLVAHGSILERLKQRKKVSLALLLGLLLLLVYPTTTKEIAFFRNFYSVIRLVEMDGRMVLLNGQIIHGSQFLSDDKKAFPLNYYHPRGPLADLLPHIEERKEVAVIGLGVGAMVYYGRVEDHWTFYEIDEDMEFIAHNYFSYLKEAKPKVDVVIGDGRVKMKETSEKYDLIVIDAFSGDAVPSHLVTKEAIELYLSKLKSNEGTLVFHVSNIFINLPAVLKSAAEELGLSFAFGQRQLKDELGESNSYWCVLTRNPSVMERIQAAGWPSWQKLPHTPAWSDDSVSFIHPMYLMLARRRH